VEYFPLAAGLAVRDASALRFLVAEQFGNR